MTTTASSRRRLSDDQITADVEVAMESVFDSGSYDPLSASKDDTRAYLQGIMARCRAEISALDA